MNNILVQAPRLLNKHKKCKRFITSYQTKIRKEVFIMSIKLYLVKPEVTEDDIYKIQKQENTVESSNGKEVGKTDFKKSIKQNLMILNLAILNLTILK